MSESTERTIEPIPPEVLDQAHRKLCRQIASALCAAMAEADMGFQEIAVVLDCSERTIRRWFKDLVDGTGTDLRTVSDLACALGYNLRITAYKLQSREPQAPADDQS